MMNISPQASKLLLWSGREGGAEGLCYQTWKINAAHVVALDSYLTLLH